MSTVQRFENSVVTTVMKAKYYFSEYVIVKGTLSRLRQFLATESPLQIMKNAFCFILKALFVLKIFKFLSWHFGRAEETAL